MLSDSEQRERLGRIQLLVLDVDGVLTGGEVILGESDDLKLYNSLDGHGIRMLMRRGVDVAIITGRRSRSVERRAAELGIDDLFQDIKDKLPYLEELLEKRGLSPDAVAYMGDDLPDLPPMRYVSVGIAVANAHEEVLARADMVTQARGGQGAVREVTDRILRAQNKYEEALKRYVGDE